jgi:hypothetical protein
VIAEDFLDDAAAWLKQRPSKEDSLELIQGRVGKEIAHLTYARLRVTPEAKKWQFGNVAREINSIVLEFLRMVPKERLHTRWTPVLQADGRNDEGS